MPPVRYTDPSHFPILIKGTQGQCIPCQTSDSDGLISRLPDIHDPCWQVEKKAYEKETVGKILVLGDIKALWAQIMGMLMMKIHLHL